MPTCPPLTVEDGFSVPEGDLVAPFVSLDTFNPTSEEQPV
jgi:hypothetical protein